MLASSSQSPVPGCLYTGGILLGKDWIVQPLTDLVWTGTGPDIEQNNQIARVAQLFYCLRTALKDLERRYVGPRPSQQLSLPGFPYITSYGGEPNGTTITYKNDYIAQIWGKRQQHLLLKILKALPFSSSSPPAIMKQLIGSLHGRGMHLPYGIALKL